MEGHKFLLEFLKTPGSVGAVVPSSAALARMMLSGIDFANVKAVVELGPGTGVFTREILKRMQDGTVFLCFETNPAFISALRSEFPDLDLIERSAADLEDVLRERGVSSVDAIVSGLPFALFEMDLQDAIVKASAEALSPGGTFRTFAYVQGALLAKGKKFRQIIDKYFDSVSRTSVVWTNVPPAFVYVCRKG